MERILVDKETPNAGWAAHLVSGQCHHIGPQFCHVDSTVWSPLGRIEQNFSTVFVGDFTLGLAAAWLILLGSYMGTQAQAVAGSRNYRGFGRADRTILTIVSIALMGAFIHFEVGDFGTYPGMLDHIPINPISIVVLISAFGGLWTFLIRFVQAQHEIQNIDREDPLPQPNAPKESE